MSQEHTVYDKNAWGGGKGGRKVNSGEIKGERERMGEIGNKGWLAKL